jgi:hypothetical protein
MWKNIGGVVDPPPEVMHMVTGPKSQTNGWTGDPYTAFFFDFVMHT